MGLEHRQGRADLIASLYATFARYNVKHPLEGCPCCVGAQDQRTIHGPLRELSADALSHYSAKAMSTWGGIEDYKHFVPRILELLGSAKVAGYHGFDVWLVAGKLTYAEWRTWRPEEQALIERCFHELWLAFLDGDAPALCDTGMIDAIRALGNDIGPWLAHWDPTHLMHAERLAQSVLYLPRRSHKEFSAWLRSAERLRALEASFEVHVETPQADIIAEAIDRLRLEM